MLIWFWFKLNITKLSWSLEILRGCSYLKRCWNRLMLRLSFINNIFHGLVLHYFCLFQFYLFCRNWFMGTHFSICLWNNDQILKFLWFWRFFFILLLNYTLKLSFLINCQILNKCFSWWLVWSCCILKRGQKMKE